MGLMENGSYTVSFPSQIKYLKSIESITCKISKELHFDEDDQDNLSIAITELFNNALHHGNRGEESKKITVTFRIEGDSLAISVRDEGSGFDPVKIRNPLEPDNLFAESGRGLFLVEQLVDELRFNISKSGSEVVIRKKLPGKVDRQKS